MDRLSVEPNQATIDGLETIEKHAYWRITSLIDDGRVDEARKVVELLQELGVI